MARAFAKISFTPNVQAVQTEMGSRTAYRTAELGVTDTVALSEFEQVFITERDSFYQATVSQSGWPYVQHRGGPAGFLKILDEQTIGYADFSGNRQYLSVGNLRGDERVSLLLMDYPGRQRLKIWGRARVVDDRSEPELLSQLELPDFRAPVERGIVIRVEAFDWNCPKYITPRYSQREVEALLVQARQHQPEAVPRQTPAVLGNGALPLTISGIRQLTPRIRAYELRHADGESLPIYQAGAHVRVPIMLADGSITSRTYSLADAQEDPDCYHIAVLRVDDGEGGSSALHDGWQMGTRINEPPENYFPLHDDDRPALLIAGGIGITPIKAMAETLAARGTAFQLHYTGRAPQDMAFVKDLQRQFPERCRFYFSQAANPTRLDVSALLAKASTDTVIYVCGPTRLIDSVRQTARQLGIADERVQFESFI